MQAIHSVPTSATQTQFLSRNLARKGFCLCCPSFEAGSCGQHRCHFERWSWSLSPQTKAKWSISHDLVLKFLRVLQSCVWDCIILYPLVL